MPDEKGCSKDGDGAQHGLSVQRKDSAVLPDAAGARFENKNTVIRHRPRSRIQSLRDAWTCGCIANSQLAQGSSPSSDKRRYRARRAGGTLDEDLIEMVLAGSPTQTSEDASSRVSDSGSVGQAQVSTFLVDLELGALLVMRMRSPS